MIVSHAYDSEIRSAAAMTGVPVGLLWGLAGAESSWDPAASRFEPHLGESSRGLLQVLPSTARDIGIDPDDLHNPHSGALAGARYLRWCWERFPEVEVGRVLDAWCGTDPRPGCCCPRCDRWRFAVGAYNAGRGSVNAALAEARELEGIEGFRGAPPGPWQTWASVLPFLPNPGVTGPHIARAWGYWSTWERESVR